jgi:hypothetical protein
VYERIREFEAAFGPQWKPSALLARIAESGATFAASSCFDPSTSSGQAELSMTPGGVVSNA